MCFLIKIYKSSCPKKLQQDYYQICYGYPCYIERSKYPHIHMGGFPWTIDEANNHDNVPSLTHDIQKSNEVVDVTYNTWKGTI
jgi:hypothetical protein